MLKKLKKLSKSNILIFEKKFLIAIVKSIFFEMATKNSKH